MKFFSAVAAATALATPALGLAIRAAEQPELDITLSQVGNSLVKAVVTNTNAEPLTLLNHNFFKDVAPIKKVSVFREGSEVEFGGVHRRYKNTGLDADSFTTLNPGESFEDIFDIASTTDMSKGGAVTVNAKGAVPYADGTTLVGSVHYRSNDLNMHIDGSQASRVKRAIGTNIKRSQVECSSDRLDALTTALANSADLASAAAQAAQDDSAKVEEYFKSSESSVVEEIVARFEAVAAESNSNSSAATVYYCEDELGYCEPNVLAYTLPSENIIANCEIYYTALPDLASECHAQDQATTTLHELTHAPAVYSPGTEDLGYGYDAATQLSTEEALANADSFALFANAVALNC
ncbi:hypothetical protein FQN54_001097 [Arachnomyces sp. PD_36]|nr:hypothetical protein FQN54_001097 [Arachnomyces sp. PD_36]